VEQLGQETRRLGSNAFVVCGRAAMKKQGILVRVLEILKAIVVGAEFFDEVESDPSLATVDRGAQRLKDSSANVVVGLGGGSALDAAKALAAVATQPESVYTYFDGAPIQSAGLPFVAVPTTAGTGAEVTINAVLTDQRQRTKRSLRNPLMMAAVALVDPELTRGMPPYLTACTGMDALVQAIEAFVTKTSNPVSDALSLRAIELIVGALPRAVQNGEDMGAREQMALGSLLSGMAFSNAGLGAVHGLAHPIGAKFGVPHGHACAVLLPPVIRFNMSVRSDRYAQIARLIGLQSAEDLVGCLEDLLAETGLSADFKQWGISEADVPAIVADSRSSSMKKNPREARDEDLRALLAKLT